MFHILTSTLQPQPPKNGGEEDGVEGCKGREEK